MAFCTKCGAALEGKTKFCTACGAPVEDAEPATASEPAAPLSFGFFTNGESSFKKLWSTNNIGEAVKGIVDTTDETSAQDASDVNNNKVFAILAYIGLLFLIPLFIARNSKFAMYHVKQGLTLFAFSIVYSVISGVLTVGFAFIPVVGVFLITVLWVVSLLFFAGAVFGIYNAATGKAKELPFIGHITFIK